MEDGTQYAIVVKVPKEWMGKWSELKERREGAMDSKFEMIIDKDDGGTTERYREKNSVSLLVRINGDTPLAEEQEESGNKKDGPFRRELFLGVPEPEKDTDPSVIKVVDKRQVLHVGKSSTSDSGGKQNEKASAFSLEFHVLAERETEENAVLGKKGLVEVIVVRCVDDEVVERITRPRPRKIQDDNSPFGNISGFQSKTVLSYRGERSMPDSTLAGETRFTHERREEVSISSLRNMKPIAHFKFALVGFGGLVTQPMTEVSERTAQS